MAAPPSTGLRGLAAAGCALLLLAGAFGPGPARAQGEEEVTIKAMPVAPGVYMLTGRGGNMGLSTGPDGAFLIDDQYAPLTEKIQAAVAEVANGGSVRFVLNTHWHGDHTGGNENLGKAGALIVAHENVRERMSVDQFIAAMDRTIPASPAGALPVVTFTDAVTFHLNGDAIRAFHVAPAHTDGDSIVHFTEADVVHMGDVFFNGMYPFIDVSSGGSVDGVIAAVEGVLEWVDGDTRIIPGHGQLAGRAELVAYLEMLQGVRGAVAPLVEAGKSRDEVVAADPLAPWNDRWGGGFLNAERFTGIVYDSLAGR